MDNHSLTSKLLAKNLRYLMDMYDLKPKELSKRSGISDRMIQYILNMDRTPSIAVVDAIAAPFGQKGWQLLRESKEDKVNASIKRENEIHENLINSLTDSEAREVERYAKYILFSRKEG
jgi:transcriptional regulator with XRE-family HTH domain